MDAKEFFTKKLGEPKTDSDKLTIAMMQEYHQEKIKESPIAKSDSIAENLSKMLNVIDVFDMLPTENEVDEWFTERSTNPPYCNVKDVKAIVGANKYRAIMIQRLESFQNKKQNNETVY